jgi:3-hydroxyacyl-CoA dehydrogenase/enoyl-CoA hydratase/3-hydroxybutyryl-CoA epimerase/3-hydroxyacyl-CoA dehydrogenase/enoyl-CoA hydratase/3-hydroxybutyryl-CoA epimerase/enoyl-CoA isomerase
MSNFADQPTTPAFRNIQRLVERIRTDTGWDQAAQASNEIRSVGIVGAGLMGTSIAAAAVKAGLSVVITDNAPETLASTRGRIAGELAREQGPANGEIAGVVDRLVTTTADSARFAGCELVIESVAENVRAKHQVYSDLSPWLSERTILASNTSSISIRWLSTGVADRGRFCGIHFCHPVRRRPLVEIVPGPQTSRETVASVIAFSKAIDKLPVVVDDGPGFLVNRLLMAYLTEALELLLDGATMDQVEMAATGFGLAMGPFRMLDEIGLDVALESGVVLRDAFPDRTVASPVLITMVKTGLLGMKTGRGFFVHPGVTEASQPVLPNPDVERIVGRWARSLQALNRHKITSRLMLPMVLEASRILEEGRVRDAGDVDLGVVFGLGFPASRGGLLYWADGLGASRIIELLEPLAPLGERARPTAMVLEMAGTGGRFYERS